VPPVAGLPAPSRIPEFGPAPVPNMDVRPPPADRQPRPSLELGVPTPHTIFEGETFRSGNPSPETRQPQGLRLPSPGATLRLPF
jgi:hypothetical protein